MKHKELEHIIAEGENYLVEFKEQINKSLARELTAFANGSGGRIFLGIDDQGVNVGVLFFSKSIEFLCEQSTITCVTFEGIDRFQVVNRKDYQEDLITNINMTMHFIKQELKVRYEMTGELRRKEVYELPLEAIREALVNAVSHRDYLQTGCHTTVEIFDDRIEIGNPGGLPKGLTEKDFGKKAVRRNQIVASLLHRVDLVENLGTGIAKIRRMCKEAGCHEPKFTFDSFFTVIFNRDSNEQFNPPSDGRLNLENGGLSKGQYSLLIIIQTNPGIQVKTISEQLHRSLNTLDKQIKKLIEKGFIERRGSKKTGGYWPGRTRRNKNEY